MTPSLPTFSMASAIRSPTVRSLLAEIVPTWAISVLPLTSRLSLRNSSTTASTACSMPRLISIGPWPPVTCLSPSRKIACASTVAVVVPSPATSLVLLATSRTICAPIFSNGSSNWISFATVTPSLVEAGEPNFLSRTTLRPRGPNVTFTALASLLIPVKISARAFSPKCSCFAGITILLPSQHERAYSSTPSKSDSRSTSNSSPSMVISVPAYLPKSILFPTATPTGRRVPSSWSLPGPTARTLPSCGFSLAVSGIIIPPIFSSAASRRFTSTLSCKGRNCMADLLYKDNLTNSTYVLLCSLFTNTNTDHVPECLPSLPRSHSLQGIISTRSR